MNYSLIYDVADSKRNLLIKKECMHSNKALWEKCLLRIKAVIPPESYSTWFLPIYPHSFTKDRFIITVPNEFYKACRAAGAKFFGGY